MICEYTSVYSTMEAVALAMYIFHRVLLLTSLFQTIDETLFDDSKLLLGEPFSDLGDPFCLEMSFKRLGILLLGREEGKEIFDTTFLECTSEMIHRLVEEICTKNECDDAQRDV